MVTINTKLPMPLRVKVLVRFQARIFTALNLKALADKLEALAAWQSLRRQAMLGETVFNLIYLNSLRTAAISSESLVSGVLFQYSRAHWHWRQPEAPVTSPLAGPRELRRQLTAAQWPPGSAGPGRGPS